MVGGDEAGARDEDGDRAFLCLEETEASRWADFIWWSPFPLVLRSLSSTCFVATADWDEVLPDLKV